jgi:hypothetical protein
MGTKCPESAPILCEQTTLSKGLCVKEQSDCNIRSNILRNVPTTPENIRGKKYSYVEEFLGRHCYFTEETLKIDYDKTYTNGEAIPSPFSCLTFNIWGLARKEEQEHLFKLRQKLLEDTIRESGADLLCLQEMSEFSYGQLKELIGEYKFASEIPYPAPDSRPISERKRVVDTYFLSKYHPSRVTIYGIPGVLGYENSILVVEFPNLVVFNLYNQAGSRSSPGQKYKWIHYSRCRYDILDTILQMIERRYSEKSIIVCGDFNFHLDGEINDWPEIEMLDRYKSLGFIDTFRVLNPTEIGLTEDTDRNYMRWNQKLIEKHYRYDGILYRAAPSAWVPRSSRLIGTDYICLPTDESLWFINKISEVKLDELDSLAWCKGKMRLPINASDHFGVITVFGTTLNGGRRKNRKTRRLRIRN